MYANDAGTSKVRADDARDILDWLDWCRHCVPRPRRPRPDQSGSSDGSWRIPGDGARGLAHACASRICIACNRLCDVAWDELGTVSALLGGVQTPDHGVLHGCPPDLHADIQTN